MPLASSHLECQLRLEIWERRVRAQTYSSLWSRQVESSPQPNLPSGEQLEGPKQAQDTDPRSPTLGIARTPMKTSSGG